MAWKDSGWQQHQNSHAESKIEWWHFWCGQNGVIQTWWLHGRTSGRNQTWDMDKNLRSQSCKKGWNPEAERRSKEAGHPDGCGQDNPTGDCPGPIADMRAYLQWILLWIQAGKMLPAGSRESPGVYEWRVLMDCGHWPREILRQCSTG